MSLDELTRPRVFLCHIDRLWRRAARRGQAARLAEEGIGPGLAGADAESLGRLLAQEIGAGRFRFSPVTTTEANIGGKRRLLYRARFVDTIVLAALAQQLGAAIEKDLPEHLYSYRTGRSPWSAVAALAAFLRKHRAEIPDRRQRGLYIIRRDVQRYGESIPVVDESPLWSLLRESLGIEDPARDRTWQLIRSAVRPLVQQDHEPPRRLDRGVPTGSPIQPVMCNLYLVPIDRMGQAIADGFYARFGDDILFAHPNPEVATRFAVDLADAVTARGLQLNHDKSQDLYFTEPGRPSPIPRFDAARHVLYLGRRVDFAGRVGLGPDKARRLLRHLRRRLRHTNRSLGPMASAERATTLCAVLNRAVEPTCAAADRHAAWLRSVVDDRTQLAQLDYLVALEIAELSSGRRGVRAFREFPPRVLRERHGLHSLVVSRNRRTPR